MCGRVLCKGVCGNDLQFLDNFWLSPCTAETTGEGGVTSVCEGESHVGGGGNIRGGGVTLLWGQH